MQATLTPVVSTTVSSTPVASVAPKNVRKRVLHDAAAKFPEVPDIAKSAASLLPGFEQPGSGVPELKPGFIQESLFLQEFTSFVLSDREFMLTLTGPTGCGKTERVLNFYSRLNVPVLHVSAHADMRMYHLTGSKSIENGSVVFVPGPLYKAMKFGYPFVMDECFRLPSTITSKFHTVGDNGELFVDETGETLKAAPGFKLIMTANQTGYGDNTGFYPGDQDQDIAYLNRIGSILCDYPAPEVEEKIVLDTLSKLSPSFLNEPQLVAMDFPKKFVAIAKKVRSLFVGNEDSSSTNERVEIAVSTRTLILWATKFVAFKGSTTGAHPLYRGLDYAILNRACPATRATVDALLLAEFGISRTDNS